MKFRIAGFILVLFLLASNFLINGCKSDRNEQPGNATNEFVEDAKCASCHQQTYEQHLQTAHEMTSAATTFSHIQGHLSADSNSFFYNPALVVKMEEDSGKIFQNTYLNQKKLVGKSMDITFGSGRKGQSYLSWSGDKLVQLPITYFTPENDWSISPGFALNKPEYNRIVSSRCMECHITYAEKTGEPQPNIETFDESKMIFRVSCQKCHGEGKLHVDFHTQNADEKTGKFIINPENLDRARRLDLCGLCHNGAMEKTKPSFRFAVGDTLSNYFNVPVTTTIADAIDVHGNQLGLLAQSECFTIGKVICESCHNVHKNEQEEIATFSARCQSCHKEVSKNHTTISAMTEQQLKTNCIDCHMPKQKSMAVAVMLQGADFPTPALLRNHHITIYPDETQKVTAFIKQMKHEN